MKLFIALLFVSLLYTGLFEQEQPPRQVTPEILAQIKKEVEKEAADYKKTLSSPDYTTAQVEFAIDTFTIEHIVSKRMEYDYSTAGMNMAMDEMTQGYDKLLNKYYNKLLKLMKPADQKVLIAAQKAWIAYRNAEGKLIGTMSKQEYSGGGSIQSNIANGRYADVVVSRAIEIFLYYDDAASNR